MGRSRKGRTDLVFELPYLLDWVDVGRKSKTFDGVIRALGLAGMAVGKKDEGD
jgi:hypothetical protein